MKKKTKKTTKPKKTQPEAKEADKKTAKKKRSLFDNITIAEPAPTKPLHKFTATFSFYPKYPALRNSKWLVSIQTRCDRIPEELAERIVCYFRK